MLANVDTFVQNNGCALLRDPKLSQSARDLMFHTTSHPLSIPPHRTTVTSAEGTPHRRIDPFQLRIIYRWVTSGSFFNTSRTTYNWHRRRDAYVPISLTVVICCYHTQ